MNAAERHATKLLIDRATRAKIGKKQRSAVRLYGRNERVEAVTTVFFPAGRELAQEGGTWLI